MKSGMRESLKGCLKDMKSSLRHKRAMAYAGEESEEEEEMEHGSAKLAKGSSDGDSRDGASGIKRGIGEGKGEKSLGAKVAEAEASAHEDMEDGEDEEDWREEARDFMKNRRAPKVKKAVNVLMVAKSKGPAKGKKG